jgi:hypothetical protein
MANQVIFSGPPQFIPEGIGDDDTFVAMATFRVLPGNKLELVAIEGHKIGQPQQTVPLAPRRVASGRSTRAPAASPPFVVPSPALSALRAPAAVTPSYAAALAERFRTVTGRR